MCEKLDKNMREREGWKETDSKKIFQNMKCKNYNK